MKEGEPVTGSALAENDREGIGVLPRSERRTLHLSGCLLAAADLIWIAQAAIVAAVLGSLLSKMQEEHWQLPGDPGMGRFVYPFIGFVCLAFLRAALQYFSANTARRAARSIQETARKDLLAVATRLSPAADFPSSGAFASHVTEQVDLLGPYYRNYTPQAVRLRVVPLAIVLTTLWFSWLAALILVICGPMIPLFMALIGMRVKAASARQQEALTRLSGILMDRIRGLETLKVFGALARTRADIAQAGEVFRIGTMRVLKIAFLSSTVLELFSALGIAFCAVFIGFTLLGDIDFGVWETPLSYSTGLFLLLLAPEFFAPLRAYAAAYHDRAAGLAALEKLSALFEGVGAEGTVPTEASDLRGNLASPPAISIESLSLAYGGIEVFQDFDLSIKPGETVLLSGPSGSGKTTLMDCLLGYVSPREGRVLVGGQAPDRISGLRNNVLWLGQAPRLFHGSVKANLLKAVEDGSCASERSLWDALELAGAADLVRRLPFGLATPLGEDGFGLSVGEMRRIALARAAMRHTGTLLLADEPTAGLDAETAADVINGLVALSKNRTTVIASHDPAVLQMPGRLVELHGRSAGKMREVAT